MSANHELKSMHGSLQCDDLYQIYQINSGALLINCRDCWPIFDKKQETQFRRACSNWLAKIAKVSTQMACSKARGVYQSPN